MRIKITKRNGDSRAWVGRQSSPDQFTKKQNAEIAAFRMDANMESGPDEAIITKYIDEPTTVLPAAAQRYVDAVQSAAADVSSRKRQLDRLSKELSDAQWGYVNMKLPGALDVVMEDIRDELRAETPYVAPLPSELIAIREEILRQLD